jgi:hypothetical protein
MHQWQAYHGASVEGGYGGPYSLKRLSYFRACNKTRLTRIAGEYPDTCRHDPWVSSGG